MPMKNRAVICKIKNFAHFFKFETASLGRPDRALA
jgi:hypothetical protein